MSEFRLYLRHFSVLVLSFILVALSIAPSVRAEDQKIIQYTDPVLRLKWYEENIAMKDKSLFKNLPWQFVGPTNISGRRTDIAVVTPRGEVGFAPKIIQVKSQQKRLIQHISNFLIIDLNLILRRIIEIL